MPNGASREMRNDVPGGGTLPFTSGETPDATLNTCERENLGQSVGAEGRGEVAVPPSIANQTSKI